MKKSRFAVMQDYLALLVRRKWTVAITFVALFSLVTLLASRLPKFYISETMLQIQPREVPTDFVKDLIAGSTDQRLNAIEQNIFSRTNLLKILSQFETELVAFRGLNDDLKVVKLKKLIVIEFPTERVRGQWLPITNVRIAFRDQSPELAQKIAARLASLFVEQESRARETQVFGTTEFLTKELEKIAALLLKSEEDLKTKKQQYRYELPSELETNLRTLDRLQMQKTGNLEAMDRYMTMQLNIERQLAETVPLIPREAVPGMAAAAAAVQRNPLLDAYKVPTEATLAPPKTAQVPAVHTAASPSKASPLEAYRAKEQEYNQLLARSTEKHPDVMRLKAELEQMKKDLPPEEATVTDKPAAEQPAPDLVPNPVYQSLNAQLRQVKTELEIRDREKNWIERQMALYNQRVADTPRVEQEVAAILRTNQDLNKQHDDLKAKLSQAKLSESLESHQKGSQFLIVDPANYPLEAATPGKLVVLIAGCLISLILGVGLAFVLGVADQRVWTQPELERFLDARVLVEIPTIVTPADLQSQRFRKLLHAGIAGVCLCAYLGCVGFVYLKQPSFLQAVDPVLETVMEKMIRQ